MRLEAIQVGDLVYIVSDRNKSQARDRYLVTMHLSTTTGAIFASIAAQLLATSYKVKLSECYLVRGQVSTRIRTYRRDVIDSDDTYDIGPLTIAAPPVSPLEITTEPPVVPLDITAVPVAPPDITAPPKTPLVIAAPSEAAPPEASAHDRARPICRRQKPAYLQDCII